MSEGGASDAVRTLLVCGSLQRDSANRRLLEAFASIAAGRVEATWEPSVGALPGFNPDLGDDVPREVLELRARVAAADAVVFSVPEYAASLPGMLKNALDWLVGSGELYEKPVAVMSTGTMGGEHVLPAMVLTLGFQGVALAGTLGVEAPRAKFAADGRLVDEHTRAQIDALVDVLVSAVRRTRA
jgi:NAD(P)H-dependent FMN reductase